MERRPKRVLGWLLGGLLPALGALGGCTAHEGVPGDPLQRKFGWFSYVGGDDIREQCQVGTPTRYRLVYNAVWEEQVRTYDLERLPSGQGAILKTTVIRGAPRVLQAYIVDSAAVGSTAKQVRLSETQYLELIRAIEGDGFGRAVPDGTRLQSYDFYWLANACAGGAWHLHAWRQQEQGFAALTFARFLFANDATGVPVNPLRVVNPADRRLAHGEADSERGRAVSDSFELIIRNGRLWGHGRLF